MPTYLMLLRATPEGARKMSEIADRYDAFKKALKKGGGRLIGAYALLGEHDYAALVEMPSEKELVRLSLGIGERGTSHVQSYRAIPTLDELCERYGDPENRRVYMMSRDVEGRWLHLHQRATGAGKPID